MVGMAKIKKNGVPAPSQQAPKDVWSHEQMLAAIRRGTVEEDIEILKKAGILDKNGNVTKTYKDWGSKPSRTPNAEDLER